MQWNTLQHQLNVSRETIARLQEYEALLKKWQKRLNLVSATSLDTAVQRHFLDSLQLLPHLPALPHGLIDLGSGAGFPGMVLAIAGAHPVTLIESDQRKVAFLREVARVTQTPVTLLATRMEEAPTAKPASLITARGCASVNQLLQWSRDWRNEDSICLFHKGKNYSMELEEARKHWQFEMTLHASISEAQGMIVELSKVSAR